MSEVLLEALMQLFALLTDVKHSSASTGRTKVGEFLSRQFHAEYVKRFLLRYDHYLGKYHGDKKNSDPEQYERQILDNLQKLSIISQDINNEIDLEEKILLTSSLLNYIAKPDISDEEEQFIDYLAELLRIPPSDYWNIKAFTLHGPTNVVDKSRLLAIDGKASKPHPDVKHIYISKLGVCVWVLHVASTNMFLFRYKGERNLYLNGHKIDIDAVTPIAPGGVINTSHVKPVYYGHVAEKFITHIDKGRIIYRAVDIAYKFSDDTFGVRPFSFLGRSGQLVGIMGGSGSGKSTLMNLLCGNLRPSEGRITINGYDLDKEREQLKGVIGYVPQDDMLNEELTVYENLWYNARLVFSNKDDRQKTALVEKALTDFDLVEARDLKVGSPLNKVLSGGQRKRLNIALELMREPSVLFVDEPTSGLSSSDSEKVMTLLKNQVMTGKLVIINIHQPGSDIYKLLDKLLIIDQGGYIVYNGNPMNAIVYFKKKAHYVNPEERECYTCGTVKPEQPLRIIESRMVDPSGKLIRRRKVSPQEWNEMYKNEFEANFDWTSKSIDQKERLPKHLYSIPGRRSQFATFMLRDALKKLKDSQYVLINLLEVPVLALLLALATKYIADDGTYSLYDNTNLPTYLLMSVVVALFVGLNLSAEEIFKDRKLLLREKFLNLSRSSYLNAKIFNLFAIAALQTALLVAIGDTILQIPGHWLCHFAVLFSTFAFAITFGLNISSGLKNAVSIYITIPLVLVPQLLFSGTMVSFDRLHPALANKRYTPIIGDLNASRWAYEALAVDQFTQNQIEQPLLDENIRHSAISFATTTWIPELRKHNDNPAEHPVETTLQDIRRLAQTIAHPAPPTPAPAHDDIARALDTLEEFCRGQYQTSTRTLDTLAQTTVRQLGGTDKYHDARQAQTNEALARLALRKDDFQHFATTPQGIVRTRQPIYMLPQNNYGRAHLYAPYKKVADRLIPTPLFNMAVLWAGTALFYITLYLDLLRRILDKFERLQKRRMNKKLEKLRA